MNVLVKTLAAVSLTIAAGSPDAQAGILAFGHSGDGYNSGISVPAGTERPVPLQANRSTTLTFKTAKAGTLVAVTYNAVCMATGAYDGHVAIRITVDGAETSPKVSSDPYYSALCSPPVPGVTTMFASNARQTAIRVAKAGTHTVRVYAKASAEVGGLLYYSSILIQD